MKQFLKDFQGLIVIGLAVLWFLLNATFFDKTDINIIREAVAKQDERVKFLEISTATIAVDVRNIRNDVGSIKTDFGMFRTQLSAFLYGDKAK